MSEHNTFTLQNKACNGRIKSRSNNAALSVHCSDANSTVLFLACVEFEQIEEYYLLIIRSMAIKSFKILARIDTGKQGLVYLNN